VDVLGAEGHDVAVSIRHGRSAGRYVGTDILTLGQVYKTGGLAAWCLIVFMKQRSQEKEKRRTGGAGDGDGGQSKNGHDGELHFEWIWLVGIYKMLFFVDVVKEKVEKMKEAIEKVDRRQESRR
jgi:hypothetical protein